MIPHPCTLLIALTVIGTPSSVPFAQPLGEQPTPDITSVLIGEGLATPTAMTHAANDETRLFITEQIGRIRIVDLTTGSLLYEPFLDITSITRPIGEMGLLGLAFHPQYQTNGHFFILWNETPIRDLHLSRFTVSAGNPDVADPESELRMLSITDYLGHHGGGLTFGPDGYLYAGIGDGSQHGPDDPLNNAQNLLSLHGKILRLDVDNPPNWIPATNPWVGDPEANQLVWDRGLRNPWKVSFDRLTGDMYIGDVGRGVRDEIDIEPADGLGARNYGWRCMEGDQCTGLEGCTCNAASLTPPAFVIDLENEQACALIGGHVYRGSKIPDASGRYFFGDYCFARIRSFVWKDQTIVESLDHSDDLNPNAEASPITTFGEDASGELYFAARDGSVWSIIPVDEDDCNDNGIADRIDIIEGTEEDCNENRIPDTCELVEYSNDCNSDGVLDSCQLGSSVVLVSPKLAPFGVETPQQYVFTSPPTALGNVQIKIKAMADLEADHEYANVYINNALVGTVFQLSGNHCTSGATMRFLQLTPEVFNTLVDGGDMVVNISASINVSNFQCDSISWVQVTFTYDQVDSKYDQDGNGIPDFCSCLGDIDGNSTVDVEDLLSLIGAWGCGGCAEDLDGDGTVDVADILVLIAAWGQCA